MFSYFYTKKLHLIFYPLKVCRVRILSSSEFIYDRHTEYVSIFKAFHEAKIISEV